ncbi:TPA: terminase small subunit [Salmonella enterica subsp. enterica serovar Eastbourne]
MAVLLNKSDMASSIGISVQAFSEWGVTPVERRGREVFYDVKAVLEIDRERQKKKQESPDGENNLEERLLQARIDLTEEQAVAQRLKNQVTEGKMVDTGFCVFFLSRLAMDLSSTLDAIPLAMQRKFPDNANVTLYSTPEYSSAQPGNSTSGQTYTLYNSLMKPTAGDVGALSVNGGRLNGSLGIGTDNALGGNSIVFGDNDTGFKWHSDGVLGIYANNALVGYIDNSGLHMSVDVLSNGAIRAGNAKKLSLTSNNNSALTATFNLWGDGGNRPTVIELDDDQGWHLYSQRNPDGGIQFVVNGQVIPGNYGNFDARYLTSGNVYTKGESDNRYVQNIQRGAPVWPGKVDEYGPAEAPAGCFLTQARHDPTTAYGVTFAYRPLQMWVGNGWRTING